MSAASILRQGPKGAQPIVLVHGAWHGAWCWQDNYLRLFAEAGFDTIAPDMRGHGALATGRSMLKHRIRHYADDVAAVIADLDQPPIVIGHSLGGFVVQHLMERGIDMRGVGLLASTPPSGAIGATMAAVRSQPIKFLKTNVKLSLYPLVENPEKAAHMFLGDDITAQEGAEFAAKLGDESFLAFLDMLVLDLPKRPARDYPICVIGAKRDALFSTAGQERMAQKLNAQACHILDAPHNVMMSKAGPQSAQIWLDWINEIET